MGATLQEVPPLLATEQDSELARSSSRRLPACIGQGRTVRLQVIGKAEELEVPAAVLRMLVDILANIAESNAIGLMPIDVELSTQQQHPADFLGSTLRGIDFRDLLEYRKDRMGQSGAAVNALAERA